MTRIFNTNRFMARGALITLGALIKNHVGAPGFPDLDLKDFGHLNVAIYLRWSVNPRIGMPSEPFKVWRRPAMPLTQEPPEIPVTAYSMPPLGTVYQLSEPCAVIHVILGSSGAPANSVVIPLADGIGFENMLGSEAVAIPGGGQQLVSFRAPYITSVLVMGNQSSVQIRGLPVSAMSKIDDWQLLETVGLPVDEGDWSDLVGQSHGVPQGMVGAETDAKLAAQHRYARGVNPYGWGLQFPGGQLAPQWQLPSAADLIADAEADVLPMLHEAMHNAPSDQVEFLTELIIRPPENPNGQSLPAEDGTAQVSPIKLLQMAAATDPLQAVTLGFGTGYLFQDPNLMLDLPPLHFGATSFFDDPTVSDWDFMVTGRWANGLDGTSKEVEYAALIPRPARVLHPPAPADMKVHFLAHQRPANRDGSWKSSARMSWERLPFSNISPVASFAVGRAEAGSGTFATPLMEERPKAAGHMVIGNNENRKDPEYPRQSASDGDFPIPNNPGTVSAQYGVATQNIFGIWSPWVSKPFSTAQPLPDPVRLIDVQLRPVDTGAGTICPADLLVELVVDWRVRSVARIDFRARLFAAATRHEEPPAGLPGGVQKSLGGPAPAVEVTFTGSTPQIAFGNVICLDPQGSQEVAPGQATQGHARRYRVTIPGFSLNYAGTPHVGIALKARLRERIAPGRVGAWPADPKVAYASDPRARPTQVVDIVRLASLPDARGQCHAIVEWQPVSGAEGYILYTSTETKMLASRDLPGPGPGDTLSQRLTTLKAAFASTPRRTDFTRVRDELLTGDSLDVALPRGSQDIHLFVVIPQSAGGVEGPWPSGPDADEQLIPFAAPKIAAPAPPTIEAQRVEGPGGFAARLRIGTRGGSGARPKRIDIYRTRMPDAARMLDSMGLPIAELTATSAPWTVTEGTDGSATWIDTVSGEDNAAGSWRYLWYRAVAWSEDDPLRGVLKGRGRPSPAVPVLVPPPDPPPLSLLTPSWPGGDAGDVLLDFNAPVPLPPTPVGAHRMSVEIRRRGDPSPLFITGKPVALAEMSETPVANANGVWRVADGLERNYRIFVNRNDPSDQISVTVRLIDPIGRVTERLHTIESGSILPLPDLTPIDVFTISGRGTIYSVTTDAPLGTFAGLSYRVRVTLTPERDLITALRSSPISLLGARFRPTPGPVRDLGVARPRSQFQPVRDRFVFEDDIADVPVRRLGDFPEGSYSIVRQGSPGVTTLAVLAQDDLSAVQFDIITPDGRTVTQKTRG
ncbi:hypothetical protein QO034_14510 [Sedimentitalea sp. JM2-8]|uniref:Uncharacterized protein n=1 Tax=Sedimentitalea xiamensis TaxID=3050037 RepID=A0ABT7FGR1_9RHOB|nr:hypothetical protein [Sedimentitalea xiamensis]MDK3074316.1 hypothetical protein [Sedimentitalea xiamensis]